MSGRDIAVISDKRMDIEAGDIELPPHQAPRGLGIANPAPLGLLCFGMTTGETGKACDSCLRAGGLFQRGDDCSGSAGVA
jgi:hypothetical protein